MNKVGIFTAALTLTFFGLTACAQDKTSAQTAEDKDAAKLSKDGYAAIRDVSLARLAIFNGQPVEAKKYTNEAQMALERAKSDNTVYTKAESDLKAPSGMPQRGSGSTASTSPTAWIPVDGSLTLGEDYVASPEKSAGVAKANEELKKGSHKQAMETLKLANIDISFVMEVAPLEKTTAGIRKATELIDAGKYYEANQALKGVEDGYRFDVTDAEGAPTKAASKTSKPAATSVSAKN